MSGVSATALQGPLEAGLWGSSRGSHREGGGNQPVLEGGGHWRGD